jgi:hypothetical protein
MPSDRLIKEGRREEEPASRGSSPNPGRGPGGERPHQRVPVLPESAHGALRFSVERAARESQMRLENLRPPHHPARARPSLVPDALRDRPRAANGSSAGSACGATGHPTGWHAATADCPRGRCCPPGDSEMGETPPGRVARHPRRQVRSLQGPRRGGIYRRSPSGHLRGSGSPTVPQACRLSRPHP